MEPDNSSSGSPPLTAQPPPPTAHRSYSRWTLPLEAKRPPRCPSCGLQVSPTDVHVVYDTLWCRPCASGDLYYLVALLAYLRSPQVARWCLDAAGVCIFAPNADPLIAVSAIDIYKERIQDAAFSDARMQDDDTSDVPA